MAKQIVHKPISREEFIRISGKSPITDLFLNTGARIAEINRIINQWNGEDDYIDIKTKKSGNNLNRIWLTEKSIKNIIEARENKFYRKSDKTIEREVDKVFLKYGINKIFIEKGKEKIKNSGGNKKVTSHSLRAFFATRLSSIGIDIKTISVLMNHQDISMTAQYIYFDERTMRVALNQMNNFKTSEGLTLPEMQSKIIEQRVKLMRAEEEYELMVMKNKELEKRNKMTKQEIENIKNAIKDLAKIKTNELLKQKCSEALKALEKLQKEIK